MPMPCSCNPLKELPGHLGTLQQLKVLDVSGMGLPCLPDEIADLQNLVKLSCQGNALSALPDNLGQHQRRLQHVSKSRITCTGGIGNCCHVSLSCSQGCCSCWRRQISSDNSNLIARLWTVGQPSLKVYIFRCSIMAGCIQLLPLRIVSFYMLTALCLTR